MIALVRHLKSLGSRKSEEKQVSLVENNKSMCSGEKQADKYDSDLFLSTLRSRFYPLICVIYNK